MSYCQIKWVLLCGSLIGGLMFSVVQAQAMPPSGQHFLKFDLQQPSGIVLVDDDDDLSEDRGPKPGKKGKKGKKGKGRGKGGKGKREVGDHEKMSSEMQSFLRRQQQEREELRARHKEELNVLKAQRQESRKVRDDRDDEKRSHDGKEKFKKGKKGKKHKGKGRKRNRERQRDHRDQTHESAPSNSGPTFQEVVPQGAEQ